MTKFVLKGLQKEKWSEQTKLTGDINVRKIKDVLTEIEEG